jgi:hypothetical protein
MAADRRAGSPSTPSSPVSKVTQLIQHEDVRIQQIDLEMPFFLVTAKLTIP